MDAPGTRRPPIKRSATTVTSAGSTTLEEYLEDVREAQRLGYAVDRQKLYLGIVAIAVVITDDQGQPRYGISAIQLADQTNSKKIRSISGQLVKLASVFSSPPPSR